MADTNSKHPLWENVLHVVAITVLMVAITWVVRYYQLPSDMLQVVADVDSPELLDLYMHSAHNAAKKRNAHIIIADISQCNRRGITRLLQEMSSMEPRVVGLDCHFGYPEEEDSVLIATIQSLDNIVMPTNSGSYFDSLLVKAQFGDVQLDVQNQYDIVRTMRFCSRSNSQIPTFAAAIAKAYKNDLVLPEQDKAYIYFDSLSLDKHSILPINEYIDGTRSWHELAQIIKGNIVLIGDIKEPIDFHRTPINPQMPGILIHAYSIDTLLSHHFIRKSGVVWTWAISIFVCVVFSIIMLKLKWKEETVADYREGLYLRLIQLGFMILITLIGLLFFKCRSTYIDFSQVLFMLAFQAVMLDVWLGLYSVMMRKAIEKRARVILVLLVIGGSCFAQNHYTVRFVEGSAQIFHTDEYPGAKQWENLYPSAYVAMWDSLKTGVKSEIEFEDEHGLLYSCKGSFRGYVENAIKADKNKSSMLFVQMIKDIFANAKGENNIIQKQRISAEIKRDIDPFDKPSISDTIAFIVSYEVSQIMSKKLLPADKRLRLARIENEEGISHFQIINNDTNAYFVNVLCVNKETGDARMMFVLPQNYEKEIPMAVLGNSRVDMSMFPFVPKPDCVYLLIATAKRYSPSAVNMILSVEDKESMTFRCDEDYIITH